MPFVPINVVNGSTPLNATWGNLVQTQYTEASNSIHQDGTGAAFVFSGLACVKDPSTANKLNMGAGAAWMTQTDNTLRRRALSFTSFTTATPSTTYFLDLNPDGTTSWATTHSGAANYLPICSVTTDGSGNISGVTDARVFTYKALTGAVNPSVKTPVYQLPAPIAATLTQNAGNAGTVVGGITFGQVGALAASMDTAALLNGTSGYISVPTAGLPTGNAAFTAECWVKIATSPTSLKALINYGSTTLTIHNAISLYINASGALEADIITAGGVTSPSPLSTNVWHHAALTWDGTTLRLYLDGVSVGTPTTPGAQTIPTSGTGCYLGALLNMSGFLSGMLDEVALYTTALSAARIQAHYNAGIATTADAYASTVLSDSPACYYRLGDAVSASSVVCSTSPTPTTLIDAGGTLKGLGGQSSAGQFGAPVVVAVANRVLITSTAVLVPLTYNIPANGQYRVNWSLVNYNGSTNTPTLYVQYTDAKGNSDTSFAVGIANNGIQILNGSSASYLGAWGDATIWPVVADMNAGTLTINYHDPVGTPNDILSVTIERLS